MKKAKKILALLLCAVLLVGATVAGTVAYLTDKDDVTNTFTVGNVQIKLDEAVVDKETGKATVPAERTEVGNTSVRMIPGRTIDKDPTVTVLKDSEDCYVRVKVTVDLSKSWNPEAAKAAGWMTDGQDFADAFSSWASSFAGNYFATGSTVGFNKEDWDLVSTAVDANDKTITYILNYKDVATYDIVSKDTSDTVLDPVFDKVVASKNLTNAQLALLQGMEIKVEAYAIQAEGFEATGTVGDADYKTAEQNAWAAFDSQGS